MFQQQAKALFTKNGEGGRRGGRRGKMVFSHKRGQEEKKKVKVL
jgi:hypothetical protein